MSTPKILVDTNVLSYLMRGGDLAKAYAPHLENKLAGISFITVGELYYGAEKARWGIKRRQQLELKLKNFVAIPYDYRIAQEFGIILAESERLGRQLSCSDAWIAACAVRHSVPLITHNSKHFEVVPNLEIITENADRII